MISRRHSSRQGFRLPKIPTGLLVLALLVAVAAVASASTDGATQTKLLVERTASERAWLAERPLPRMGVWADVPPYTFLDDTGNPQGLFVDNIGELERRLGSKIDIVAEASFADAWQMATRKDLDMLVGVTPSARNLAQMNLSETYHVDPIVLVTRTDFPFVSSIKEFNGKRLVVSKGHVTEQRIRKDFPQIQLVPIDDIEKDLCLVSKEQADALAVITWQIRKFRITNLKIAAKIQYEYRLFVGVRKDWPERIPILNKALAAIETDKKEALYDQWIAIRFEQGIDWGVVWKIVVFLSAAILSVFLVWNRRLRHEIQEKEKAERALKESESLFRTAIERSPIAMLVCVGRDEAVAAANRKFSELFGYEMVDLPTVSAWWPLAFPTPPTGRSCAPAGPGKPKAR